MATCYRHPSRETGVSCSNCGNPICPDCMTPTPVGMRCPECARQKTKTCTARSMHADPTATYVLIAVNVLMWIGTVLAGGGTNGAAYQDLQLVGVSFDPSAGGLVGVSQGEYWRLITGGFLHAANPLHILFNMYILYWLGQMLEPALGHAKFLALYFTSLLAGSFGALLLAAGQPADRRRVGRGVRADGRRVRHAARPRHQPDAERPRCGDHPQPRAELPDSQRVDRRPPGRPGRRRARGARDGVRPGGPALAAARVRRLRGGLGMAVVGAIAVADQKTENLGIAVIGLFS